MALASALSGCITNEAEGCFMKEQLIRIGKAAEVVGVPPALVFDAVDSGRVRVVAMKTGHRLLRTTAEWVREWAERELA